MRNTAVVLCCDYFTVFCFIFLNVQELCTLFNSNHLCDCPPYHLSILYVGSKELWNKFPSFFFLWCFLVKVDTGIFFRDPYFLQFHFHKANKLRQLGCLTKANILLPTHFSYSRSSRPPVGQSPEPAWWLKTRPFCDCCSHLSCFRASYQVPGGRGWWGERTFRGRNVVRIAHHDARVARTAPQASFLWVDWNKWLNPGSADLCCLLLYSKEG